MAILEDLGSKFCFLFCMFLVTEKIGFWNIGKGAEAYHKAGSSYGPRTKNEKGKLLVQDVNISLSAVFQQESCKSLTYLTIHAENNFVLDTDVTAECTIKSMIVFAQTWFVTGGYRKIHLIGRNGMTELSEGINGSPGGAGENGGHFLGIYREIQGAKFLHIDVSGGNGGNGQHGKPGIKGYDGSPGEDGKPGTNGGDGGVGGKPGYSGHALIFSLNKGFNEITITRMAGQPGSPGKGGIGGKGGAGGPPKLIKNCNSYGGVPLPCPYRESLPGSPGKNGKHGNLGANSIGQSSTEKVSIPTGFWAEQISEYRAMLLSSTSKQSVIFATEFYTDGLLQSKIITPLNFAQDFVNLEISSSNDHKQINYTQEFVALLERIQRFEDLNLEHVGQSGSTRIALEYVRSAVITKICLLTQRSSFIIVDVPRYAEAIAADLQEIEHVKHNFVIFKEQSKLTENILKQSKSVALLIENTLVPEINRLRNQFQQVLNEATNEMMHSFQQNKTLLVEKLNKYRDAQLKNLFVDLVVTAISAIFPCAKGAAGFVNQIGLKNTDSSPSAQFYTGSLNLQTKWTNNQTIAKISKMLQSTLTIFLENNPRTDLQFLKNASLASKIYLSSNQTSDVYKMFKVLLEGVNLEIQTLHSPDVLQSLKNFKTQIKWIALTSNMDIASRLSKISNEPSGNIFTLKAVKEAEKEIEKGQDAIIVFQNDIRPFMESAFSLAVTESLPFKAHNILTTVKHYVNDLLKGLTVEKDLLLIIDKVKNTLAQTQQLYDNLRVLQEKIQMVNFISSVSLWKSRLGAMDDKKIMEKINEINLYVQLSLAVEEYQKILQSCRLQVLPYANRLHCGQETSHLHKNTSISSRSHSIEQRVSHILDQIQETVECMRKEEATILAEDSTRRIKTFSTQPGSQPFCTWHHSFWREYIAKLIKGDEISLRCDFRLHPTKSAVKFKFINLNFKCANLSHQIALSRDLAHFELKLTHLGQNIFKVGPNLFRIGSERVEMVTCFQQTWTALKTLPAHCVTNIAKNKIDAGNFMLSPFAYWEFQIIDPEPLKGLSFAELQRHYKVCGSIDIDLEGEGAFIDDRTLSEQRIESMNLDHYYASNLVAKRKTKRING